MKKFLVNAYTMRTCLINNATIEAKDEDSARLAIYNYIIGKKETWNLNLNLFIKINIKEVK